MIREKGKKQKRNNQEKKFSFKNWQKKNQPLVQSLKFILKKHPKAKIYLVGGAVRDFILNYPTQDLDFVVQGVEIEDLEKTLKDLGKVDLVGKNFSVFKFVPSNGDKENPVDIALPRKEHALGTGAYRDVKVKSDPYLSIKDDLSRRDFTINAIAWPINLKKKKNTLKKNFLKSLEDPFNGQKDIKNRLIRAVGQPEQRFKEDYSRLLRAIRLACQLDFDIEKETFQAIKQEIKHINDLRRTIVLEKSGYQATPKVLEERIVPWEIIGQEFLKSLVADPVKTLDLYDETGAFKEIMPEVLKMKGCPQPKNWHSEGDVWAHTRLCLTNLESSAFKKQFPNSSISKELILAVLLHDIGKPYTIQMPPQTDRIRFNEHDIKGAEIAEQILKRLKLYGFSHLPFNAKKVIQLIGHHMLLVQGDILKMKARTIEKYFFNPSFPGKELLELSFIDILSTIPEKGKQDFSDFKKMLLKIEEFKSLTKNKEKLPPFLLSGNEIMERYNLAPGPKIGQLKDFVREAQLKGKIKTKKQAYDLLDKYLNKTKIK